MNNNPLLDLTIASSLDNSPLDNENDEDVARILLSATADEWKTVEVFIKTNTSAIFGQKLMNSLRNKYVKLKKEEDLIKRIVELEKKVFTENKK